MLQYKSQRKMAIIIIILYIWFYAWYLIKNWGRDFIFRVEMKVAILLFAAGVFVCNFFEVAAQKDYEAAGLREHNQYRSRHRNTPGMTLDNDLNQRAQRCAKYYNDIGKIDHSCPHKNGAGENLYSQGGSNRISAVEGVRNAANSFYSEIKYYDFNKPGYQDKAGHFTQLVWVNSKKLGVGFYQNSKNQAYVVNLYSPHGNIVNKGEFEKNVQRLK